MSYQICCILNICVVLLLDVSRGYPIRGVRCNSYTLGDVGGTCQWPPVNICVVLLVLDVSLTRFVECVVIRIHWGM
jgi:hypothetical protein